MEIVAPATSSRCNCSGRNPSRKAVTSSEVSCGGVFGFGGGRGIGCVALAGFGLRICGAWACEVAPKRMQRHSKRTERDRRMRTPQRNGLRREYHPRSCLSAPDLAKWIGVATCDWHLRLPEMTFRMTPSCFESMAPKTGAAL